MFKQFQFLLLVSILSVGWVGCRSSANNSTLPLGESSFNPPPDTDFRPEQMSQVTFDGGSCPHCQ